MDSDPYLSIAEAAQELGLSISRIQQLTRGFRRRNPETGEIVEREPQVPTIIRSGRRTYIHRDDLEKLKERPTSKWGPPLLVDRQGWPMEKLKHTSDTSGSARIS